MSKAKELTGGFRYTEATIFLAVALKETLVSWVAAQRPVIPIAVPIGVIAVEITWLEGCWLGWSRSRGGGRSGCGCSSSWCSWFRWCSCLDNG